MRIPVMSRALLFYILLLLWLLFGLWVHWPVPGQTVALMPIGGNLLLFVLFLLLGWQVFGPPIKG